MTENETARIVVDSAFKIHSTLGPGLFESVYETVLAYELQKRGCHIVRQRGVPVIWDEIRMKVGFRADLIVSRKVIVEVKSIESLAPVHSKQLRTFLVLTDFKLGLLINFNVELIKFGLKRVVKWSCRMNQECAPAKSSRRKGGTVR
ncbi:MAG: GxxExxY protein [Acidobacteria bacterium]|nr:GxxExxY protein [Acidobacteriota bacterium]